MDSLPTSCFAAFATAMNLPFGCHSEDHELQSWGCNHICWFPLGTAGQEEKKIWNHPNPKSNCDVNKAPHNSTHLEVLDEEAPGRVEDHRVESVRVQGQRVVVVKAVDVHFSQVDLIVGIDGWGVERVASTGWDQVWTQGKPSVKWSRYNSQTVTKRNKMRKLPLTCLTHVLMT